MKEEVKILSESATFVLIRLQGKGILPEGHNFIFDLAKLLARLGEGGEIVAHLIDAETAYIEA